MPSSQQIYAGTDVTAADLQRAVPLFAYKATATNVSTSTSPAADPDLVLQLNANTVYEIELLLLNCAGGASPGLKYTFSVPSGSTGDYMAIQYNVGGPSFQSVDNVNGGNTNWGGNNTCDPNNGVLIKGLLSVGSTAGAITFEWAQASSSGTNTTVGAYSWIKARQAL